jgi:predicted ATPase
MPKRTSVRNEFDSALHLRAIERRDEQPWPDNFPYSLPFMQSFARLDFQAPITFLVGENGSGKSTFLELLACAIGSITVGSKPVRSDPTLAALVHAADRFRLVWSKRTHYGFFMRAEDFFGYVKWIDTLNTELAQDLEETRDAYQDRSIQAQQFAELPYQHELSEIRHDYGDGLDSNSHGEGFLKLFQRRFSGPGLYLLDEPEAPLSPTRQLTLLAMLNTMVKRGGQFVIATHSPILMAFPSAQLLGFDGGRIHEEAYDQIEQVAVMRSFLDDPQQYLHYLIE